MNSDRVKQVATEALFRAVSMYATDIPIIIVGTRSDDFIAKKFQEGRAVYKDSGLGADELVARADEYSRDQIKHRLDVIKDELSKVEGGRFDNCVAVNRGELLFSRVVSKLIVLSHSQKQMIWPQFCISMMLHGKVSVTRRCVSYMSLLKLPT